MRIKLYTHRWWRENLMANQGIAWLVICMLSSRRFLGVFYNNYDTPLRHC